MGKPWKRRLLRQMYIFEELVQELEKQAALWGMKEVFLVMDDKQSVYELF